MILDPQIPGCETKTKKIGSLLGVCRQETELFTLTSLMISVLRRKVILTIFRRRSNKGDGRNLEFGGVPKNQSEFLHSPSVKVSIEFSST